MVYNNTIYRRIIACSIAAISLLICSAYMLKDVLNKKTSYIYSPGLFGSPMLIGRYCPFYVASTGEMIFGTLGGSVLGNGKSITTVVFSEIETKKRSGWIHGTVAPWAIRKAFTSLFGIFVRENPENHDDTVFNYLFNFKNVNIGQEQDIALLRASYAQHVTTYPSTKIILYGDSRGAATTFNFIAADHPHIAGAVIEGVFDTVPHIIKHCLCSGSKGSLVEWSLNGILKSCAGNYKENGPFPADYAERIPYNIPLLLVTSKTDRIVPVQCTIRLYRLLRKTGHTNVHLLILPASRHETYMVGNDRDMYETCVHAFYQHCGVEYDAVKAEKGRAIFAQTQPTDEELVQKYRIHRKCCNECL